MKKLLLSIVLLLPLTVFAQRFTAELNFSSNTDQQINLGRYNVGTAIEIQVYISGGWAQDGGIYHLVADWAGVPKVTYRGESSISDRLKFYGYVDPTTNSYAFLYATWDNQAPTNNPQTNDVRLTISSEATFDTNWTGAFSNASELENILVVQSSTGKVGIGTTEMGNHRLTVEGSIGSREIVCKPTGGWADFVFDEAYELPKLEDVEEFVALNKHLPEIPSEEEIYEEGINLGKMDAKLLQKIEELTLYLIEQNKEIKALKEKVEKLEQE